MYILVYMKVTQQISEWGNSTAIRLPKKVLQAAKWKANQEVAIDVQGHSVVLTPIKPPMNNVPSLDELVGEITPENVHGEIDWGPAVGKEIW